MPDQLHVHFRTDGRTGDERLVREYVLEAVERLPTLPDCDGVGFVPAGHKPGVDGLVILEVFGDPEPVVDHERDRWDRLVDQGLAEDWTPVTDVPDPGEYYGERGAELRARLSMLAARLSRLVFEEFDQPPDAVDEHPEESSSRTARAGTGWWTLFHYLSLHQAIPYEEEADVYAEGIRDALLNLAEYREPDAVEAKLDEIIEVLERTRDEIYDSSGNHDGG